MLRTVPTMLPSERTRPRRARRASSESARRLQVRARALCPVACGLLTHPPRLLAAAHFKNYKHECPSLMINTNRITPEIMHLDNLNVAKQCWTKGVMPLMSEFMREFTTDFFKVMKVKLDVKSKSDGRAGTAWFKASAWAEMVNGSNKVPSGLAPWLASLLFYIGADFVEKQGSFTPAGTGEIYQTAMVGIAAGAGYIPHHELKSHSPFASRRYCSSRRRDCDEEGLYAGLG